MIPTIRVLIVDGDPVTRERLHAVLDLANDVVIVGEADSGEGAIERAGELTPDIVFMDVRMPGIGGIEATKAINQASPETRVILFTVDESRASISEAIQAGVSGYLLKDADADELVNAARLALEGKAVIHPALTAAFIEEVQLAEKRIESPPLSKREKEILQLMADGASMKRISHDLRISPNTVRQNIQRILHKLGAHSRLEVVARFRDARSETIEEPEPKTRTQWIDRLSEPHLRRILITRREDLLRQKGKTPSAAARADGRRLLNRVYDEMDQSDLRNAVHDLTREMSDEEFARLMERTRSE